MQNEAGDSFFLERALFLAENFISRSRVHQNLSLLAGKLDLDKRKLFMFTRHTLFSNMRLPHLAIGRVSSNLKNRQLFSWGVWWSHGTYSPEIFPLTVFTTQKVLASVLLGWKNVLLLGSYCIAKFEKLQKMDVWEVEGWCGSVAPPILRQNACSCLAIIITSHSNFKCKVKDEIFNGSRFVHPPRAPHSQPTISHWGGWDARLPFRQVFDSSRTTLIECQQHHFECAREERAAFL